MAATLSSNDLRHVVQLVPKDVRKLLTDHDRRLFIGGGFIREIVAGNAPVDIDLFADTEARCHLAADDLIKARGGEKFGTKKHVSKNAVTVITPNRLPVQFITRWTFTDAAALVASFDFTVCQAAIWRSGNKTNDAWSSEIHPDFYADLAGRNLVYTSPVREEEAGGSLLRVVKFLKRGYTIQVWSLAGVIARLNSKAHESALMHEDPQRVICGLLREVDPLMVIDGFDVIDDHEPLEGEVSQ